MEGLHYYFLANTITEAAKKHSIFLTVCGVPTFQLLRNLVQPKDLSTVSYTDLLALLESHCDPAPLTIVQRYRFHTHSTAVDESVATFVVELKAIGRYCKFENSLNETICDRIVCGVNDNRIQRLLLQEPELTYDKAKEAASKDVQKLQNPTSTHPSQPIQYHNVHPPRRYLKPTILLNSQKQQSHPSHQSSCYG